MVGRMRHAALFAMLATAFLSPSIAQTGSDWLSADELSEEMFGVRLVGEVLSNGEFSAKWNECITPQGQTVYSLAGEPSRSGRMYVSEDDRVCFNYGLGDSCFSVRRIGENYAFQSLRTQAQGVGLVFETRSVERDVKACRPALIG